MSRWPDPLLVYRDEHLLVVDKPAGLAAVPGRGADKEDSVLTRLARHHPDIRVVHRLDWPTSGLLVLALNANSQRQLNRQFQQRQVTKHYIAVVAGQVGADQGEIDLPLRGDWPNRPRQMVDPVLGKPAQTQWRCLQRQPEQSRLQLTPITGRSHQLRVHLQAIGHPILGDALYGDSNRAPRLLLHASALTFDHPASGQPIHFTSPVPF